MGWFSDIFLGGNQAKAAKRAAWQQEDAANQSKQTATDWTNLSLADLDKYLSQALSSLDAGQSGATAQLDPYAKAGTNALTQLQAALGLSGQPAADNFLKNFRTDPGYQFSMDQGTKALDQSASARGGLYSGAAAKELETFGHGLADQQFGTRIGQISGVANQGQAAASNIANILSQFAGMRSNAQLNTGQTRAGVRSTGMQAIIDAINAAGAARAGGTINAANAKSAGWGNLLKLFGTLGGNLLSGGTNPLGSMFGGGSGGFTGAGLY